MNGMRTTGHGFELLTDMIPLLRPWVDGASAPDVLSFGGLAVAMVAGILLLVLNRDERPEVV